MKHSTRSPFAIAIAVSLGGFVFGFDVSVISGVVGYVTEEFGLTVWQQGMVVSSAAMATILATVTVVPLSDALGRKTMLLIVAMLYVLSALGSAFAPSYEFLVLARALGGLAFGSLMITPIYVAEIAPPARRGFMVAMNQMNIVLGLSAAYFSNYALVRLSGSPAAWVQTLGLSAHAWRWMLGVEILPATTSVMDHLDENANLREVCIGTNKGFAEVGPDLESQLKFYLERPRRADDPHGQAPVLWTATALLR